MVVQYAHVKYSLNPTSPTRSLLFFLNFPLLKFMWNMLARPIGLVAIRKRCYTWNIYTPYVLEIYVN
jgi:hypothetical protein